MSHCVFLGLISLLLPTVLSCLSLILLQACPISWPLFVHWPLLLLDPSVCLALVSVPPVLFLSLSPAHQPFLTVSSWLIVWEHGPRHLPHYTANPAGWKLCHGQTPAPTLTVSSASCPSAEAGAGLKMEATEKDPRPLLSFCWVVWVGCDPKTQNSFALWKRETGRVLWKEWSGLRGRGGVAHVTETQEVSCTDMTWPPNPQNSAETPKPMNNRVPAISRKRSSLFLPSTSPMQPCAICPYTKVCKIVQVEDRSAVSWPHFPSRRVNQHSWSKLTE